MNSTNEEKVGLRRSTRLSVLSKPPIPTIKKEVQSYKRKAPAKKAEKKAKTVVVKSESSYSESNHSEGDEYKEEEDNAISSEESNDENISMELSAEDNISMEEDFSDSESDEFVSRKKRKVAPARKSSAKAPVKKNTAALASSAKGNRGKQTVKMENIEDTKINWASFEKKLVDKNNGLMDDAQFLLNKDVAPYLPSTSKSSTKTAGRLTIPSKPNKFSSGSEDEEEENDDWEEMEPISKAVGDEDTIEIHLKKPQTLVEVRKNDEDAKWEKMVRLEIARKRREFVEDCHKVHFLCYIAHLRFMVKTVVEGQFELVSMLNEILPPEVSVMGPELMEQAVHIFRSAFNLVSQSKPDMKTMADSAAYINHIRVLLLSRGFTSDKELAVIFFALCHCIFKLTVRLCLAFNPMPKTESEMKASGSAESAPTKGRKSGHSASSKNGSSTSKITPVRKTTNKAVKKKQREDSDEYESSGVSSDETIPEPKKSMRKKSVHKTPSRKPSFSQSKTSETRNYWVEYYDDIQRRWICVDPLFRIVDKTMEIEKACAQPMLYVVGVDSEMGARDLTAKYASGFLSSKFRKLRVDEQWLNNTFRSNILKSDERRDRMEDAQIREHLRSLPMPSVVSEFKNHPLYALEKDLLKFEAIYPEDTEELGEIRGHKILPRSAVHHLQGELNWIRLARTVKKGEMPYKVVKARPQMRVPKEKRVPLSLKLYGYWQTTQYIPVEVDENGKIPRNEHGNIYIYQKCMVPKNCLHLRLPGIQSIARRLGLEAAPAVTGWEFSGGGNHPLIEGCIVLEKDAETLHNAWTEYTQQKAEKDAKKAEERVWTNWKRLIKGKLLLENMRTRFK
uniref:Uncharacterized protein n=1 Tax=Ditylenchus dipsaci TaxID=166011 RepID=A0A915D1V3_9BILA